MSECSPSAARSAELGLRMRLPARIGVEIGTHGEELGGQILEGYLQEHPLLGVESHVVHPDAARVRRRSLGSSPQVMAHYTDGVLNQPRPPMDPNARAAYIAWQWLVERGFPGDPTAVLFDVHDNPYGLNFFSVGPGKDDGPPVSMAVLTAGHMFGHRICSVADEPIYNRLTNFAVLESSVRNEKEAALYARKLYSFLGRLAVCTPRDLIWRYSEIADELLFCERLVIPTLGDEGSFAPYISALERMPRLGPHTPLSGADLPAALRDRLAISPADRLLVRMWGYDHMGPALPEAGAVHGIARKDEFGSLWRVYNNPPVIDGTGVRFRPSWMYSIT